MIAFIPQSGWQGAGAARLAFFVLTTLSTLSTAGAQAQDPDGQPPVDPEAGLTSEDAEAPPPVGGADGAFEMEGSLDVGAGGDDRDAPAGGGAFLLAGKLGGGVPFNDLDVGVSGAIEIGYLFSRDEPSLGAYLDISYFVPQSTGKNVDTRLSDITPDGDGAYSWHAWQKELTLQPTFLYRLTMLSRQIIPYVGIGPRIYLLQTVVDGKAGDAKFPISREQSTKFGLGLPLGVEFTLGPGGVIAELLLQWGPLKHDITGDTHLGSASLWVGYRALL